MSRENPQWLVFYGTYYRDYSAFPWFDVPPGTILHAADPNKLVDQMRETELRYRPGPMHLG